MKNLLFRAKSIGGNEWVYGDLIHNRQVLEFPNSIAIMTKDGSIVEVNPETVCQRVTIATDNHPEIWEGDILTFLQNSKFRMEVYYNTNVCSWCVFMDENKEDYVPLYVVFETTKTDGNEIIVAGNIVDAK